MFLLLRGSLPGGLLPERLEGRLVLMHEFVLPPRDGLVALPLELRAKVGELRVPLVLELGAQGRHRGLTFALDLGAKVGERGVSLPFELGAQFGEGPVAPAIEFLAQAGQRGVSFTGDLLAQRRRARPVTFDLLAEGGQRRLMIGGGPAERGLHRLFAVVGRDRHHVGEQAVQRLVDRAADFLDDRLGQALNAFVERHRQGRPRLRQIHHDSIRAYRSFGRPDFTMRNLSRLCLILYDSGGCSSMDIVVTFPGGSRVDAQVGQHVVKTDQPARGGGDDSAPAPFSLFLASIATCAGIYVLGFCKQRDLPTDGITLVQRIGVDPRTGMVGADRHRHPGAARLPGEVPRGAHPSGQPVRGEEAPRAPADVRRQDRRRRVGRGFGEALALPRTRRLPHNGTSGPATWGRFGFDGGIGPWDACRAPSTRKSGGNNHNCGFAARSRCLTNSDVHLQVACARGAGCQTGRLAARGCSGPRAARRHPELAAGGFSLFPRPAANQQKRTRM